MIAKTYEQKMKNLNTYEILNISSEGVIKDNASLQNQYYILVLVNDIDIVGISRIISISIPKHNYRKYRDIDSEL